MQEKVINSVEQFENNIGDYQKVARTIFETNAVLAVNLRDKFVEIARKMLQKYLGYLKKELFEITIKEKVKKDGKEDEVHKEHLVDYRQIRYLEMVKPELPEDLDKYLNATGFNLGYFMTRETVHYDALYALEQVTSEPEFDLNKFIFRMMGSSETYFNKMFMPEFKKKALEIYTIEQSVKAMKAKDDKADVSKETKEMEKLEKELEAMYKRCISWFNRLSYLGEYGISVMHQFLSNTIKERREQYHSHEEAKKNYEARKRMHSAEEKKKRE